MAVIVGGIHVHVHMAVVGEDLEYVCRVIKAVYLANTQVIVTHSPDMSVRLVSFPCRVARHNHQVGTVLVERFKQEGKAAHMHTHARKKGKRPYHYCSSLLFSPEGPVLFVHLNWQIKLEYWLVNMSCLVKANTLANSCLLIQYISLTQSNTQIHFRVLFVANSPTKKSNIDFTL